MMSIPLLWKETESVVLCKEDDMRILGITSNACMHVFRVQPSGKELPYTVNAGNIRDMGLILWLKILRKWQLPQCTYLENPMDR